VQFAASYRQEYSHENGAPSNSRYAFIVENIATRKELRVRCVGMNNQAPRIHKVTGSGDVFDGVNEGANEMKTEYGDK
jgi:hypothetical protein